MRKLSSKLNDKDIADVEYEITTVLDRARRCKRNEQLPQQAIQQPAQPYNNYYVGTEYTYHRLQPESFMQALNSNDD